MMFVALTITIVVLHAPCMHAAERPEVGTRSGRLRGTTITHNGTRVDAYLGIPYAAPPLGELRFKKPRPAQAWSGVRDVDKFPSACPQYSIYPFPWYDNSTNQSEDCLYLNIWVPSNPRRGRAVLYWIYGGGLSYGSNSMPLYHAQALAATGDVIVVSVNHRLGPLGFLYTGTEDAPGNVGLYDILQGLKWVNDNIDNFGGNRSTITLWGHSSGADAAAMLTLSPLAKDLYKRAILQSGGSVSYTDSKEDNLNLGQDLAKHVGCANDTMTIRTNPKRVVKCLRGIDARRLVRVTSGVLLPRSTRSFSITFSDPIVGNEPHQRVRIGDYTAPDLLIGNVLNETTFLMTTLHPDVFGFHGERNVLFNKSYGENLLREDVFSKTPDKERAVRHYLGNLDDSEKPEIRTQVGIASMDFTVLCPSFYYAQKTSLKKSNVYYYLFTHRPSATVWAPWLGVVHRDEIPFVFGLPTRRPEAYSREEVALSKRMMMAWANFAKTGNPGDKWPSFDAKRPKARILKTSGSVVDADMLHVKNCDFLRPYFGMSKPELA